MPSASATWNRSRTYGNAPTCSSCGSVTMIVSSDRDQCGSTAPNSLGELNPAGPTVDQYVPASRRGEEDGVGLADVQDGHSEFARSAHG